MRSSELGVAARVVDLRWLAPLPVEDVLREANATGRVLVVDETRRTGGVSEGIVAALVDAKFDGQVARVASADSFIPLGDAANLVLVSEQRRHGGGVGARRGARLIRAILALLVVAVLGLAAAVIWWSGATLAQDNVALAKVEVQPLGGSLVSAKASGPSGRRIPLTVSGGKLLPRTKLKPGEVVTVEVVVRRPGWLGWALGKTRTEHLTVQAPIARLAQRWPSLAPNAPLRLHYVDPVDRVVYRIGSQRKLVPVGGRVVPVDVETTSGTALVAAAARSWERLGPPVRVTWFPQSSLPVVLVSPAAGKPISPLDPIRLTFSKPVDKALGGARPHFSAPVQGGWHQTDSHTLVFAPGGYGFPLNSNLHLVLPPGLSVSVGSKTAASNQAVSWTVAGASFLRLQQLLAEEGYLPVSWQPAGEEVAQQRQAEVDAAVSPPAGTFAWRYANTPAELQSQWIVGQPNQVTRGAVMMFEHDHDLAVDGSAGPQVWHALIADAIAGKKKTDGYSYVYVHRNVPQLLTLWHNGSIVLDVTGQHGRPGGADGAGHVPGVRAHPGRHDERHEPRRLALQRSGDPVDQLLPRRRCAALVQPCVVRHAAEPWVRGVAACDCGEGVALHADRDARHDRELNRFEPDSAQPTLFDLIRRSRTRFASFRACRARAPGWASAPAVPRAPGTRPSPAARARRGCSRRRPRPRS